LRPAFDDLLSLPSIEEEGHMTIFEGRAQKVGGCPKGGDKIGLILLAEDTLEVVVITQKDVCPYLLPVPFLKISRHDLRQTSHLQIAVEKFQQATVGVD
jgi:hypothetical protein